MNFSATRRWIVFLLFLFAPLSVQANPVILDPVSLIAFCVVAFWAFVVEAGFVAIILMFFGLSPLKLFGAYFGTNAAIFFFFFQPLAEHGWIPLPALECFVVLLDGTMIKILARSSTFQEENFSGLGWLAAFITSGIANALSYFVGYIASHRPWIVG